MWSNWQIDVSFSWVCPVIDHEFRHNIDYFDNVMTKFMTNNRTDPWKTDVNLLNWIYYILCVDISVIKPWLKMIPVKWYDIISLHGLNCPIKYCNNLVGPIRLHFFSWRLAPGVKFGGKNCLTVLSTKWPHQDLWMSPMKIFLSFSKRTKTRTRQEKPPKM